MSGLDCRRPGPGGGSPNHDGLLIFPEGLRRMRLGVAGVPGHELHGRRRTGAWDEDEAGDMESESQARQVATLEEENRELRELMEGQLHQQGELESQVMAPEGNGEQIDDTQAVDSEDCADDCQQEECRQLQIGGNQAVSRVDHTGTAVRRWELDSRCWASFI